MAGQPVWLASLSRWNGPEAPLLTADWSRTQIVQGAQLIDRILDGVGDRTRERLFRMNLTLCKHRACTDAEVAGLPPSWQDTKATHLAGGPIEVLWETEEGAPSTRPCEQPVRIPLGRTWLPDDCGECATCLARTAAVEA